jgi:hypothetical protein
MYGVYLHVTVLVITMIFSERCVYLNESIALAIQDQSEEKPRITIMT